MSDDAELTSYDSIVIEDYLEHVERPFSWNNLYERPAVIARLPSLKGKNVLDTGCASGFFTEYALKNGARVTAVDISKVMTERLVARIKSVKLTIFCADISRPMSFLKSNTYDCVICSLVLHYIKDWEPLLAELHRVLKKGGRLVISTHHPFEMYQYLKLPSYYDFKMVEDTWGSSGPRPFKVHYYVRPLKEVLRPIVRSKFNIISIDEPLPTKECKELAPEVYKRLMERPGFLFIVLEK
ncbi:MAG: hypothetical protein A2Y89_05650 [Chloroflexi bacterium RBG_13_51_18]|nr:MAG: hypothetical protein A2Y89_05650 [Chloroflexi bacterium RBG_13_51_18]